MQSHEPVDNSYYYVKMDLSELRSKMWDEAKKYLIEYISENKPFLTDEIINLLIN